MKTNYFEQAIQKIVQKNSRFSPVAYSFLKEALDCAINKEFSKNNDKKKSGHITGQQLMSSLQTLALEKYGPLSHTVLTSWGVTKWADFGDIVFLLIGEKVLQKNDGDSELDFETSSTLEDILCKPFLPSSSQSKTIATKKKTTTRKKTVTQE